MPMASEGQRNGLETFGYAAVDPYASSFVARMVGGVRAAQEELAFPAANEHFLPTAHLASARNSLADTRGCLAKDSVRLITVNLYDTLSTNCLICIYQQHGRTSSEGLGISSNSS